MRWYIRLLLLVSWLLVGTSSQATEYRPLPPSPKTGLSSDWLIYDAPHNQLVLYLPDYHTPARAYYQWTSLQPGHPVRVAFVAQQNLCVFLDNRLIFHAPTAGAYTLDLATHLSATTTGPHLLCVWQPEVPPNIASFTNTGTVTLEQPGKNRVKPLAAQPRFRTHQGQTVFLCFMLLIGLLYGGIRATYQPNFSRIYQLEGLWRKHKQEADFLVKPTLTWLNIILVLIFSLSFALLLVAIHTNIQSIGMIRRLFDVPESAIVARVFLYTGLIAGFILGKYLFLELMGYIFDVTSVVVVQYREFMRTILFMGLFLPLVMLLYLSFNQTLPATVLWVSNGVVSLMLVGTVLRIASTLHRRSSLLNLHLFSYLCATEVIPLIVLLKLIVFTY